MRLVCALSYIYFECYDALLMVSSALNDTALVAATVIMDENMQPLAAYNENVASPREHQVAPPTTRHFFTRKELLQKQRDQQTVHNQQYQALLQHHQQEKRQFGAMKREGKLSADSEARFAAEIQHTHRIELLELQEKQEREQADMMNLIFQCASVASMEKEKEGKISADEQVNYQPSVETSDGDAAPSVAAGAIHNINNHADSPPTQLSSAHSTTLPLNGNEHLTVQDIDACESVRPQSPSSLTKSRREEIQTVMKDKTLGREEKQNRLAEIRDKYALIIPTPPPSRWKKAAAAAFAANTVGDLHRSFKQEEGRTTPVSVFIKKLKANDPSLTGIILDGRTSITESEWSMLFDSLEENTHLTHLSVAACSLDDDAMFSLALALVENEALFSLNLSNNPELTNETGNYLLKVLMQSNVVMKKLIVNGTSISSEVSGKIQDILDDRDETKTLEKLQAARQLKIEELLAFSASEALSRSSDRLSERSLETEKGGSVKRTDENIRTSGTIRPTERKSSRGSSKGPKGDTEKKAGGPGGRHGYQWKCRT